VLLREGWASSKSPAHGASWLHHSCPLSRQRLRARTILDVFQSPQAFATKGCSLARKRHWNCSFLGVAYLHPWVYNGNRLDRLLHSRAPCHAAESDDRIAM